MLVAVPLRLLTEDGGLRNSPHRLDDRNRPLQISTCASGSCSAARQCSAETPSSVALLARLSRGAKAAPKPARLGYAKFCYRPSGSEEDRTA